MTKPALSPTVTSPVRPTVMPAATHGDDLRLRAWLAFLRAHAAIVRRLDADLEGASRISLAEYDVLLDLAAADERRLRMSELADHVLLTRSGISRLVDRLERRGLIKRASCPTDARGAWAVLTAAGLGVLWETSPVHIRGVETYFLAAFDDPDRETLARTFETVLARLRGPNPPAGSFAEPAPQDGDAGSG